MVAKITFPSTVERALNYNEQKVKKGAAECLYAHQFLQEATGLNFYEKRDRFALLNALNKRAKTNSVHVSLNFHPDEKLEKNLLIEIATAYMQKIGFEEQPYLVYQHTDAGHPHLHIVTTNIQKDGKRISLHNIGKDRSAKARKEIEMAFGLKTAEAKEAFPSASARKAHYGNQPTKQAISNAVQYVLSHYTFTSLPELNAVLSLYNVTAERGAADSAVYRTGGLLYRVLDERGKPVGVPIKASSIYGKPTLRFLEGEFQKNEPLKARFKKGLQSRLDWVVFKNPNSFQAFKQELEGEKISLVVRQNEQGLVYGLTYVDHLTKSVFNGSELGKAYSANAILQKTEPQRPNSKGQSCKEQEKNSRKNTHPPFAYDLSSPMQSCPRIIAAVINPVDSPEAVPHPLKKQKKKKRKRI